jgi:hypothetical protein
LVDIGRQCIRIRNFSGIAKRVGNVDRDRCDPAGTEIRYHQPGSAAEAGVGRKHAHDGDTVARKWSAGASAQAIEPTLDATGLVAFDCRYDNLDHARSQGAWQQTAQADSQHWSSILSIVRLRQAAMQESRTAATDAFARASMERRNQGDGVASMCSPASVR